MTVFRKYGVLFFLFILCLHCLFIYTGHDGARIFTKLLLVPILLCYLVSTVDRTNWRGLALPVTALFFSFLGDAFLTQTGTTFFLLGMVSFIVTHLSNAAYFYRLQKIRSSHPLPALMAALCIGVAIFLVFNIMKDNLGSFTIPILIYMTIIGAMGVLAANITTKPVYRSAAIRFTIPGALLFIVSDAILALDKFHWHANQTWAIPVMATYGMAQLSLVRGTISFSPWVEIQG